MDELVLKGMARWPNVPAAFGWLELDGRGTWRLKGERIGNTTLVEFINRNYAQDDEGRWFFQNGPQRVYVKLHATPYIVRAALDEGSVRFTTHTCKAVETIVGVWLDDLGRLILGFDGTAGVLDDRDLVVVLRRLGDHQGPFRQESDLDARLSAALAGAEEGLKLHLEGGTYDVRWLQSSELSQRFRFQPDPRPAPGQPEC